MTERYSLLILVYHSRRHFCPMSRLMIQLLIINVDWKRHIQRDCRLLIYRQQHALASETDRKDAVKLYRSVEITSAYNMNIQ